MTTPAAAVTHTVDEEERGALDEILGGNRGLVDASVPPITFVTINTTVGFHPALYAALGAGAALFLFRLVRRERLRHAVFGFLGVTIAVLFALRTGEARNFFLPGILLNVGYALAFAISALVKRPALGLGLAQLEGHATDWYTDDRVRRYFSLATWLWASLFATRAVVQTTFYLLDKPGWLAAVKLALGWPVFLASLSPTQTLLRKARAVRPAQPSVPAE